MESAAKIKSVNFSFYTPAEIERLATVEVKSQIAFDTFRNPWPEGLYDSRMGISPYDRSARCVTCGKEQHDCPGHMGFIKLVFPVYNLFLLKELLRLLRAKCFYCHKFVATNTKVREFRLLFTAIHLGLIPKYLAFRELTRINLHHKQDIAKPVPNRPTKAPKAIDSDDEMIVEAAASKPSAKNSEFEELYRQVVEDLRAQKFSIEKQIAASKDDFNTQQTSFMHFLKTATTKDFFRECHSTPKCVHCLRAKPTIKLENNNKFYAYFKDKSEAAEDAKVQLINPLEVRTHVQKMFEVNPGILGALYGKFRTNKAIRESVPKGFVLKKFSPDFFFLENLPVTPNRFRPESQLNGQSFLHAHTLMYTRVLALNDEIKDLICQKNGTPTAKPALTKQKKPKKVSIDGATEAEAPAEEKNELVTLMFKKWIELQEAINLLFNSDLNLKTGDKESGIKQLLEKKEGIFRMKIMGKRVNYSGRSVISPDPNLHTSEVGVPLFMATKLTYPEHVNAQNYAVLRQAILNGPHVYPGAVAIEENGVKKLLDKSTMEQRLAIANRLLENCENKTVFRHMITGDYVLFNRQPTLHKPSIMTFRSRVLPKELTIRMHFVNCAGFNADFDGDEMNVHLLQNEQARSEAKLVSLADLNYILPTSKAPVRGMIQDFIFAILFVTSKDMFLDHAQYAQLLFEALNTQLDGGNRNLHVLPPAIRYPHHLWTGKQLVTNIIKFVAHLPSGTKGLYARASTRISPSYFCRVGAEESTVVIRDNELLTGVFDKNQIGASSFGFVHSFFELYGHEKTGLIFSAITRLCVAFLKLWGFSCGMQDLINTPEFEERRVRELNEILQTGVNAQFDHFHIEKPRIAAHNFISNLKNQPLSCTPKPVADFSTEEELNFFRLPSNIFHTDSEICQSLEKKIADETTGGEEVDRVVKGAIAKMQSKLFGENSTVGLQLKFPFNNLSTIILSGAKGSVLNQNLITCNLGQQELEGRRAPIMSSGKTLPCFQPFDPNPRCNGFVADRFLTGLRPQEFFFHCMAGREGLIDTAVKTSRSGYLQRILVKNLESFAIEYDMTVRDLADKLLIQVYYGEDGLNSMKVNVLENLDFLFENFEGFRSVLRHPTYTGEFGLSARPVADFLAGPASPSNAQTLLERFNPAKNLGAVSDKARSELEAFIRKNEAKFAQRRVPVEEFKRLFHIKYFESLMCPGECVGAIAAQSFGEPSTQMTLNTFHLAGHGGANVTLGIPRLKELLTTKNTKSPVMFLELKPGVSPEAARRLCRELESVSLQEVVARIEATTKFHIVDNGRVLEPKHRCKLFNVVVEFEPLKIVEKAFGVSLATLESLLIKSFVPKLMRAFKRILNAEKRGEKREGATVPSEAAKRADIEAVPEEEEDVGDDAEKDFFAGDEPTDHPEELAKEFDNHVAFRDEKFYISMKSPLSSNYGMVIKWVNQTGRKCAENGANPQRAAPGEVPLAGRAG